VAVADGVELNGHFVPEARFNDRARRHRDVTNRVGFADRILGRLDDGAWLLGWEASATFGMLFHPTRAKIRRSTNWKRSAHRGSSGPIGNKLSSDASCRRVFRHSPARHRQPILRSWPVSKPRTCDSKRASTC
jgi:hypothetical protein